MRSFRSASGSVRRCVGSRYMFAALVVAGGGESSGVMGGGAALVWLGSRQGWAAAASACAACLRRWRCSSTSMKWGEGLNNQHEVGGEGRWREINDGVDNCRRGVRCR